MTNWHLAYLQNEINAVDSLLVQAVRELLSSDDKDVCAFIDKRIDAYTEIKAGWKRLLDLEVENYGA